MPVVAPQSSLMPAGLPAGRRTPRGRTRWYLVHVATGTEHATCKKLLGVVPKNLLSDAFVLSRERWVKRSGTWRIEVVQMYQGYLFVETPDIQGLNNALQKLSFHVDLVGARERACVPLADEARDFFMRVIDGRHLIRSSVGSIEDGVLHVQEGPLAGLESRVVKVDRHRRCCWVGVGELGNGFLETLPLVIPFKS